MNATSFILVWLSIFIFIGGDNMNFVYDLVLNFCDLDNFYEFYEWDTTDNLTYVQEIPIFKIDCFQMNDLLQSSCKLSSSFLEKIYKKTSTVQGVIPYATLFTDSFRIYAFLFDCYGNMIKKSSLLVDEENAIMEEIGELDAIQLDYEVIEKCSKISFLTRNEKKIQSYLLSEIKSLYKNKKYDEINYLYYEYFSDSKSIREKYLFLIDKIQYHYCSDYSRLYDIIKLTYSDTLSSS